MEAEALLSIDNAISAWRAQELSDRDKTREVAEKFEAVFISQFLDNMFEGIDTAPPFGGGMAENIFRSVLNQEIATKMSGTGGFGIADSVHRELIRLQEV